MLTYYKIKQKRKFSFKLEIGFNGRLHKWEFKFKTEGHLFGYNYLLLL